MPLDGGEEHQLLVQRFLRLLDEEFDQLGDFLRVRQLTLIPGIAAAPVFGPERRVDPAGTQCGHQKSVHGQAPRHLPETDYTKLAGAVSGDRYFPGSRRHAFALYPGTRGDVDDPAVPSFDHSGSTQ